MYKLSEWVILNACQRLCAFVNELKALMEKGFMDSKDLLTLRF
jgi:hypothetical protein